MTVPLFPLVSQHVVFVVKFFVAWLIPDVPSDVKARIKRERFLVQEYLHNYEVEKLKMQLSQSFCLSTETASLLPSSPNKHQVLSECIWTSLSTSGLHKCTVHCKAWRNQIFRASSSIYWKQLPELLQGTTHLTIKQICGFFLLAVYGRTIQFLLHVRGALI